MRLGSDNNLSDSEKQELCNCTKLIRHINNYTKLTTSSLPCRLSAGACKQLLDLKDEELSELLQRTDFNQAKALETWQVCGATVPPKRLQVLHSQPLQLRSTEWLRRWHDSRTARHPPILG